jgi:hypothetical protein
MIAAGALLTGHSLGIRAITVDTTSLFGVDFTLLCPWLATFKRIKIGDFEAEIDPAEVKRLTADIRKALPELPQEATPTPPGTSAGVEAVKQLALSDRVWQLPSSESNWSGGCAACTHGPVSLHHLLEMLRS